MKLLLKILAGLVVVIVIAVIGLGYYLGGPEREVANNPIMNAVSKQTNQWDHRVNLTPEVFELGSDYLDVDLDLGLAGFNIWEKKVVPTLWIQGSKNLNIGDLRRQGEIAYALDHGNFVCDMRYFVFLKFDNLNKLTSADGMKVGLACL